MPFSRRPAIQFIREVCGLDLRHFQEDFLTEFFREENGRRVYTAALWGLPRGNGKTEVAAAVALAALVADGRRYAEVIIAAGSRDQAAEAFKSARRMIETSEVLSRHLHVLPGRKVIVQPSTDSYLRIVSAEGPLQHGLRPSAVIFDEVWNQPNRELWDALVGGLVKVPEPMLLCISTAGWDSASLLADLCKKGESGEDPRFLYRWHGLPTDSDLDYTDPETWLVANPAMSCERPFLSPEGLKDSLSRMHEAEFRRWHLNQWTKAESQWLPPGVWEAQKSEAPEMSQVALGFSGSYDGTVAGLVGCTPDGFVFVVDAWEVNGSKTVSRAAVDAAVAKAMKDYQVTALGCNPPGWDTEIESWAESWGVVIGWEVRKRANFTAACGKFYNGVVTGQLTHDGDPRLTSHLQSAHPKKSADAEGFYITDSPGRSATIAKAAVIAYELGFAEQQREPLIAWR